jgi:hypothetical protein
MEDRSNKTIICSVLFLDIVGYSKKSVTGQISLKDRFNTYLSEAIHDVPVTDRIILDTGDGAAVNFLGDVESALTAALRLRTSLLSEDPNLEPQLLVRIGINLGPVRLVRDINGQPNIVGDGINVAQRVMGFADPSQILVSRSYFDAVSRLSAQYTGMFHYQGSRTDKHVREHEVYAIGYPGDQTSKSIAATGGDEKLPGRDVRMPTQVWAVISSFVAKSTTKQRLLYAVTGIVALLAAVLTLMPEQPAEITQPVVETMPAASAVAVAVSPDKKTADKTAPEKVVPEKTAPVKMEKTIPEKTIPQAAQAKHKAELESAKKTVAPVKKTESHVQGRTTESTANKAAADSGVAEPSTEAYISVICKEDAQIFVDGTSKGKLSSGALTVTTKPGKHKVILTHPSFGMFADEVFIEPGKTARIKPKPCN